MNKQYYAIKTDGSQIGPYPESTLRILLQSGYLRADNPVWTNGNAPQPLQEVLKNAAGVIVALGYIGLCLALIVPSTALLVRRLHDCGQSGWMALLGLIPYVGGIFILIYGLLPSKPANQWGVGPKPPLQ